MNTQPNTITAALREAADLLDAHPGLPQPYITSSSNGTLHLHWFLYLDTTDLAEQKGLAARIIRALGGKWNKSEGASDSFRFTQSRSLLAFDVQTKREAVCERIVTGTETVTIPAVEAQPEQVVEREVVEWRCLPLLADDQAETVAVAS